MSLQAIHQDNLLPLAHLDGEGLDPWRPPGTGRHMGPPKAFAGHQHACTRVPPGLEALPMRDIAASTCAYTHIAGWISRWSADAADLRLGYPIHHMDHLVPTAGYPAPADCRLSSTGEWQGRKMSPTAEERTAGLPGGT